MVAQYPKGAQHPEQVGQRLAVVGQVPAHGAGQVADLSLQPLGQLELLLQPRDLHAGAELSVALPVHADEDVALGQVGPVQLLRRVRPRSQSEHHRRQPQRRNGPLHRPPLLGQLAPLAHCRAHEHPETLVSPRRTIVPGEHHRVSLKRAS
jgi:hypothetical protein